MSAAHKYAVQMLLKVFGLNFEELETKVVQLQEVVMKFDPVELQAGLQMVLDYRKNQEQNEMRLLAIMEHFGITDPVTANMPHPYNNPPMIEEIHNG